MKILFVNATDIRGGAAQAAQRIAGAVRGAGAEVRFLVKERSGPPAEAMVTNALASRLPILAKMIDRAPVLAYPHGASLFRTLNFSPAWARGADTAERINRIGADIVHLHWVNYGLLGPEGIARIRAPVVWTLHDMWPFTGGCHYSGGCARYGDRCGLCPVLGSRSQTDLSRRLLDRKLRAFAAKPIRVVAPSAWLGTLAQSSAVFGQAPVSVIPNPLDTVRFSPGDRSAARGRLGLPPDVPLILFGAANAFTNPHKGYAGLRQALEDIAARPIGPKPHLAVFGADESQRGFAPGGMVTHLLGRLADPSAVADAYRAADVFAAPSLQDNLPSTVMESLGCGTPVVAFDIGGMADMIDPGRTGRLVRPGDLAGLADALVEGVGATAQMRAAARLAAETRFSPDRVGAAYLRIYEAALAGDQ